jgi:hypothetical protein
MKTYSETKNKEKFDWNKFLDERIAEQPKDIKSYHGMSDGYIKDTRKRFKKEIKMSSEWVTCACGNQCSILERDSDGEPVDDELAELGSDFYYEVDDLEWKTAKLTLKAIEKRSAKLIAEKIESSKKTLSSLGYKIVAPAAKKIKNK